MKHSNYIKSTVEAVRFIIPVADCIDAKDIIYECMDKYQNVTMIQVEHCNKICEKINWMKYTVDLESKLPRTNCSFNTVDSGDDIVRAVMASYKNFKTFEYVGTTERIIDLPFKVPPFRVKYQKDIHNPNNVEVEGIENKYHERSLTRKMEIQRHKNSKLEHADIFNYLPTFLPRNPGWVYPYPFNNLPAFLPRNPGWVHPYPYNNPPACLPRNFGWVNPFLSNNPPVFLSRNSKWVHPFPSSNSPIFLP